MSCLAMGATEHAFQTELYLKRTVVELGLAYFEPHSNVLLSSVTPDDGCWIAPLPRVLGQVREESMAAG